MIFSLEALEARYGDSLLLHYGEADDPRLILIDGGPSGVFKASLLPRLEELRAERGGKLPLEILMVSHLDDDHVRGVLELAMAMDEDGRLRSGFDVKTLWLNAFQDTVGDKPLPSEVAPAGFEEGHLEAVIASVGQGRNLRDLANKLHWPLNRGFDQIVSAPDDAGVEVDLEPLRLTVVGPRQAELEELREEWEEKVKELAAKPAEAARIADYLDKSVYNLSSIVCLVEVGEGAERKRMLLTGDARGDKILLGLEAAGELKSDPLEIDLLKVPHHGSSRNLTEDFFRRIKAKHLVISANGKYGNPDLETLKMISAARPDDDFTLHLTNSDLEGGLGAQVQEFFAEEKAKDGRDYGVAFRSDDALSLRVDLLD